MEISKKQQYLILLTLVFLASCELKNPKEKSEVSVNYSPCPELKKALDDQILYASNLQEEHQTVFQELSLIQSQLNSIDTDNVIAVYEKYENVEGVRRYSSSLQDKANQVKYLIDNQKKEIRRLKRAIGNNQYLNKFIDGLEEQLAIKNEVISQLRNTTEKQLKTIRGQQDTIVIYKERLITVQEALENASNKRFTVVFSKKNANITEQVSNSLYLPYPNNKIEVLSNHPSRSFSKNKSGKGTILEIKDGKLFWSDTRFFVINIGKRKL